MNKKPTKPKSRGRGRPSAYRPDFAGQAEKLCHLGATDVDLADFFGVAISTISAWKVHHREFSEALKADKAIADARVERSLFSRALGYTFDAVKIFPPRVRGRKPLIVPYREHVPPDTTACIFWLKNRRPDLWRDAKAMEHSGTIEVIRKALEEIENDPFELPKTAVQAERDRVSVKAAQAVPAPAGKPGGE
jgi:hypothetical protein